VKEFLKTLGIILLILFVIFCALGALLSHQDHERAKRIAQCGLYSGDRVKTVVDGLEGMVTTGNGYGVFVRFRSDALRTDTRLLGSDGTISREPYALVYMQCYELRHVEQVEKP
jgi:hypothetical protein